MNNISAVIVTYYPDIKTLNKLISVILNQVENVIIVDNSDNDIFSVSHGLASCLYYIKLRENQGIAKAQNIGIAKAKELNSKDVILFDQDSTPSVSLIADLLAARGKAKDDGVQVAAIGPSHIDEDSSAPANFVHTENKKVTLLQPDITSEYMSCDFIIASGCLLEMTVLDEVGLMEDELFIDCVDIEWGYRAKAKGYVSLCAPHAKMYHKIGEKPLMLFGRTITTHKPIRHYYFYRNFYLLFRRDYVPSVWKKYVLVKSTLQACIFSSLLAPRFEHFKAITKGIYHGLKGKSGKYEA